MTVSFSDIATAIRQFREAIARREAQEEEYRRRFLLDPDPALCRLEQRVADLSAEQTAAREAVEREYLTVREQLDAHFSACRQAAQQRHDELVSEAERQAAREVQQLDQKHRDSEWVVSSVMDDTAEDSPRRQYERFKQLIFRSCEEQVAEWTALDEAFRNLVAERGWRGPPPVEPVHPPRTREEAQERFGQLVEEARSRQTQLKSLTIPKLFVGYRPVWMGLLLAVAAALSVYFFGEPSWLGFISSRDSVAWIGLSVGTGLSVSVLLLTVIYSLGAIQFNEGMRKLQQLVAEAGWVHRHWLSMAKDALQKQQEEFEVRQRSIERQRQETFDRYHQVRATKLAEIETQKNQIMQSARQELNSDLQALREEQARQTELIEQEHQRQVEETARRFSALLTQARQELETASQQHAEERETLRSRLESDWAAAVQELHMASSQAESTAKRLFPNWSLIDTAGWEPPVQIPPGIPCGYLEVDLTCLPGAIPEADHLRPEQTSFRFPAAVAFPERPSLLLKTDSPAAREAAAHFMQSVLLRWLTLLPAGKVRLTILDPVGLGESFSGFMHLADQDELLINSRIWTEAGQIESRLADLTQHMENVLQTYLRNEFPTIEAYNEHAGEVAEPYHLLVVAGFPHKFTETSGKRLASIIQSGPKCGVYTLIQWDCGQPVPHALRAEDLEHQATIFTWRKAAFVIQSEPDLAEWPLIPEEPPAPETFTRIVRRTGELAREARRVEVAFTRIAPQSDDYWTLDSRRGLDIPLGRAGATKLQHLRLGRGTSQHMLVAGKTGSGKSTFLHALITNLSLHYSPAEVQFFLVDFKKGVEFKDYAAYELPHARVIAIESDREFGVSALQRLDEILQQRGELFRRAGVQDIATYRDHHPNEVLPRILLVIDEFQEFFVEDDRVSQAAALFLDRLIRQGRAFGIHVVLGSQTLGGAYTLARSTLGQVAVRVALQCSEADAHLILSEDNTAARLLTRPGEAIYNDANGLVEGNHLFQIAWISDEERGHYLAHLQNLSQIRNFKPEQAIVFEGNIAANPAANPELAALLGTSQGQRYREPLIWLGEAIEIRPPTSLTFARHAGANLLLVGPAADEALGVMSTACVTLAAWTQQASAGANQVPDPATDEQTGGSQKSRPLPTCLLLDGSLPGSWEAEQWRGIVQQMSPWVEQVTPGREQEMVNRWYEELLLRETQRDRLWSNRFLLIYHLSRFRDLRKSEEDYGFTAFGTSAEPAPLSAGKQFAELLARGPELGLHIICWCDGGSTVERWLSRQSLKEFEWRICFQMNASDSSQLIDSPLASRLGSQRALLYREADGSFEKFRPYRPPDLAWLHRLQLQRTSQTLETATDLDSFALL